jgi:hypothetical protein
LQLYFKNFGILPNKTSQKIEENFIKMQKNSINAHLISKMHITQKIKKNSISAEKFRKFGKIQKMHKIQKIQNNAEKFRKI